MRLVPALFVFATALTIQELDDSLRKRFSVGSARLILQRDALGSQAGKVADRISDNIRNGCPAFVAQDGKAVAIMIGKVDKLGIDPPGLLTEEDRYRLVIAHKELIPYNVSQGTHLKYDKTKSRHITLRPLVLLDRYRTLCGTGAPAIMSPHPPNSLVLAIIDDRQRGLTPNIGRQIERHEQVGSPIVVGVSGDWYRLQFTSWTRQEGTRVKYLEVHGRTLQIRPAGPPKRDHYAARDEIARHYPDHEFVPTSEATWKGRTYFMAYFRQKEAPSVDPAPFVWDGKELTRTDPWTIAAVSVNGRYGWLLNRKTGQSWLITKD